jgi:hypothetical protein
VILPTKGIAPSRALLAVGARVLSLLEEPKTVSRLWDETKNYGSSKAEITFDWFVLALDLLFIMEAIEQERGRLQRRLAKESAA